MKSSQPARTLQKRACGLSATSPTHEFSPSLLGGAAGGFLSSLRFEDLQRLREVVKRVHMKLYPAEHYTDREADRIIESLGPRILEQQLKRAVDSRLVAAKSAFVRGGRRR